MRTNWIILAALLALATSAGAAEERAPELQSYLEGTCGMAGLKLHTDEGRACAAEELATFRRNLGAVRTRFEQACTAQNGQADATCLEKQSGAHRAALEQRLAAISEDSALRNLPELRDPLARLCEAAFDAQPGTPPHDMCISQHALHYAYFAKAVVAELRMNPALEGF
jgi:hypothetical protein